MNKCSAAEICASQSSVPSLYCFCGGMAVAIEALSGKDAKLNNKFTSDEVRSRVIKYRASDPGWQSLSLPEAQAGEQQHHHQAECSAVMPMPLVSQPRLTYFFCVL